MKKSGEFVANLLQASASGYAGLAAASLLKKNPELPDRYGPGAFDHWRAHLEQRIFELATALAFDEPQLFIAQVLWSRAAFAARSHDVNDLRESLDALAEVLPENLPDECRDVALPVLDAARQKLDEPVEEERRPDPEDEIGRLILRYLESALNGDRRAASQTLLDTLDEGGSLLEIYETILLPAQREVGRLWHRGELNVAEEHVATAIGQRTMALLSQRREPEAPNGRTVVLAGVAGNVHDMALRAAVDVFEQAGWRSILLGPDLPLGDLLDGIVGFEPDLVLFSASMPQQLPSLVAAISALRRVGDGSRIPILVGGRAFLDAPDLWRRIGADGFATNLRDALEEGLRLVGGVAQGPER